MRVKFFAWSLSLEKINTSNVLQHKRPFHCLNPNRCVMCNQDSESIPHLFLQCQYARYLWVKVYNEFGLDFEVPTNLFLLIDQGLNRRWKNSIKSLWVWRCGLLCGLYGKKGTLEFLSRNISLSLTYGTRYCIGLELGSRHCRILEIFH